MVGATTRSGQLTSPLRDRFGFTAHMEFYSPAELLRVISRSAGILSIELPADAGAEIAKRSRGTRRIANRLLRRVRASPRSGRAPAPTPRGRVATALTWRHLGLKPPSSGPAVSGTLFDDV